MIFPIASLISISLYGQTDIKNVLGDYADSLNGYGIVALVDDGDVLKTAAAGVAFEDHPVSTNNRFCIGSVTKLFTATLILQLQESGLLHVDDEIRHYLDPHKFIDSTITIRHLLTHTSGLGDYINAENNLINTPFFEPYGDYSDAKLLAEIDSPQFEKGKGYAYCNTNHFLLRIIIERAMDKPYAAVLQENILNPFELENTFPYYSNQIERLAHPIIGEMDLHDIPKLGSNAVANGVGNMVSDVFDLNTFIRALLIDKTVLKSETLDMMTTFQNHDGSSVGMGLFEENCNGRKVWGHTGRQVSYISYLFADPETGHSFVVLNNNANDPYIDEVFEKICDN